MYFFHIIKTRKFPLLLESGIFFVDVVLVGFNVWKFLGKKILLLK